MEMKMKNAALLWLSLFSLPLASCAGGRDPAMQQEIDKWFANGGGSNHTNRPENLRDITWTSQPTNEATKDEGDGDSKTPCDCYPYQGYATYLKGNGDPHQNYVFQQVNAPVNCPGGSGTVGTTSSITWTLSGNGGAGFITGGFSVGSTYGSTESYSVACREGVNQACLLRGIAHTAYTVDVYYETLTCRCVANQYKHGEAIIFAPNLYEKGHYWVPSYNIYNPDIIGCVGEVKRTYDYHAGPRGGPEYFHNHPADIFSSDWKNLQEPKDYPVPKSVAIGYLYQNQPVTP